ncbi:hypothetical protein ACQJBY_041687 [Aegilops geniculata]
MAGDGRRVVVFPFPFHGHATPLLRLASVLHTRGFAVTIFHTELRAPDPAEYPADYRFVPLRVDVPPELMASEDIAGMVTAMSEYSEAPFKERLTAALAEEGAGVRCVIADVAWYKALSVSSALGVPAMGVMTASAANYRVYMAYPMLIHKGYLPVQEARKEDLVEELPPYRVKDLLRLEASSLQGFADLLRNTIEAPRQSAGLIFNTLRAIEADDLDTIRQEESLPVFALAPLHKLAPPGNTSSSLYGETQADRECLHWLDTQEPGSVVYVSFGSLAAMDPHEFVELAWGLAASKRPFLWVVRPTLIRGYESGELPHGLDDQIRDHGRLVSWAPQVEVLAHPAVGAFITHSGWNSTVEAVSEGVPMICLPLHGDQFSNARYVCDVWKVGVEIEASSAAGQNLERGKIKAAIDKIVHDKGTRERMDAFKLAADEAVDSQTEVKALVDLINSF